ncbi:glycosyltransferase family 39 protein [Streptomyces sp. NBC_01537]|uniref:glycosyltransferase family 39 protein n=1 Tax=Streptomyces sp. NBC_01537 TaxID=2903896 RepID=UPI0038673481
MTTPLLWEDELNSWDVASRSTGELLGTVRHVDAVLGTYYLFLHGWMALLGDSVFALRLPSALAMAGAAACAALCGRRLFGRRAGLAGGLLFALIPAVTRYAHEARPYALVVCAVSLSTLMLLRALEWPERRRHWAVYSLCLIAAGLLHLLALTALTGQAVAAVALRGRASRRALWSFGLAVTAAVLAVLPIALLGYTQAGRQISWIPHPNLRGLVDVWPQLFGSALAAGVVLALAALPWQGHRSATRSALALAVLPTLLLWTISHGERSYFFHRYLLFTLPAWVILAGAGLALARSRAVTAWVLVALAFLMLPGQAALRQPFAHFNSGLDYSGAARVIEKYHLPGDAVVYDRGEDQWRMLDVGVRYYLSGRLRMRDVFLGRSAADSNDLQPKECLSPARCVHDEPRVWLVVPGTSADPFADLPAAQRKALFARYTATGTERVQGIMVALLQRHA